MNLPENYIVERRAVKHARLRVNEDESVNLFVPLDFTDVNIQDLLEKKASWIESKQRFFSQKTKILLRRNEILLLGNRFTYYYSTKYKNKVVVNYDSKTIQAQRNLLDPVIQEHWIKNEAIKYIRKRVETLSVNLFLP
ncbi:MAG: M48 family metallopeptidase, partial [Bacteroidales bacterium]|nr:M48 family metallopeptidase [Bacteroidales bacterium]